MDPEMQHAPACTHARRKQEAAVQSAAVDAEQIDLVLGVAAVDVALGVERPFP
jgi:hypothetical protein